MMVLATRQSWRVMVLLSLVLAFACSGATCIGPVQGTLALREAQDVFNEAALLTNKRYAEPFAEKSTDVVPPESAQEKYARVVQLVNEEVLNALDRDDLRVNAWALLAFSEWQLKQYAKANIAAETGKDLYERVGLQTNRRDYGMLLILRGFVKHSQAYESYQEERAKPKGFLDMAMAERLSQAMAAALDNIDEINAKLGKDEPVVIYANRQQLLIIENIMLVWADAQQADMPQQEMVRKHRCEWSAKGLRLWQDRFPKEYAIKNEVDQLGGRIKQVSDNLRCV